MVRETRHSSVTGMSGLAARGLCVLLSWPQEAEAEAEEATDRVREVSL